MADTRVFRSTPGRVLVALLGVVSLVGCAVSAPVADPPAASDSAQARTPLDLRAFLTRLTDARTDPRAWAALQDRHDPAWPDQAERLRSNLTQFDLRLEPTGRTREVTGERAALLGESAQAHGVRATWSVPGTPDAVHTLWFILTDVGDGPALAGLDDGPEATEPEPLWVVDPVRVTRGDGVVAIAADTVDPAPWLATLHRARTDVARLDPGPIVAQLPSTAAGFERVLGVRPGSHRRVAAGAWPFGTAVHLVVNPEAGGATTGEARQVLVTHETVHVVTGSVRGQRPLWLTEGYADLIALENHPTVAAAHGTHLAEDQRDHGVATELVTDRELAPTDPRVDAHYQRAWWTVRVLDRGAPDHPAKPGIADRVHAAVVTGTPLPDALAAEGWSEDSLAEAVERDLRSLAGG